MLKGNLAMAQMPPMKPGYEAGMLIPAVMRSEAGDFGLYTFDVFIGVTRQKSIPVTVLPASELEQG